MGALIWIGLGAIIGLLAAWIGGPRRFAGAYVGTIAGGAAGAFLGGAAFSLAASRDVDALSITPLLAASAGALGVLAIVSRLSAPTPNPSGTSEPR
jgi:uncharacterized membrane protein YeaQ/YmgE (transglycosylase-associated protein family)